MGASAINEMPVTLRDGAMSLNGQPMRLALPGVADGAYTLAIRPDGLQAAQDQPADLTLPVTQVEFTGHEIGLRLSGQELGLARCACSCGPNALPASRRAAPLASAWRFAFRRRPRCCSMRPVGGSTAPMATTAETSEVRHAVLA